MHNDRWLSSLHTRRMEPSVGAEGPQNSRCKVPRRPRQRRAILEAHQKLGPTIGSTLSRAQKQVTLPGPTQLSHVNVALMLILYCRIIELLVQLFWKQNRYLNNNSRYNGKRTDSHSRGGSVQTRESHEQGALSCPIIVSQHVIPEPLIISQAPSHTRKRSRKEQTHCKPRKRRHMRELALENSTVSQVSPQFGTPLPRLRIQIPFWIITRESLYTEELWNNGKFQSLTLADFLEGVAEVTKRSHIEKIKLTLRTPFSNTILTIHGDAEDAWTTAKLTFAEKLKESRADARTRSVDDSRGYKILVEPFYEQVIVTDSGTEADEDMFNY
jgi:hypothetical protein